MAEWNVISWVERSLDASSDQSQAPRSVGARCRGASGLWSVGGAAAECQHAVETVCIGGHLDFWAGTSSPRILMKELKKVAAASVVLRRLKRLSRCAGKVPAVDVVVAEAFGRSGGHLAEHEAHVFVDVGDTRSGLVNRFGGLPMVS